MALQKRSKKCKGKKKIKPVGTYLRKKSSSDGSVNYSNLKKQVERAKVRTVQALDKMAGDEESTFAEFIETTRIMQIMFEEMGKAMRAGERVKKLTRH